MAKKKKWTVVGTRILKTPIGGLRADTSDALLEAALAKYPELGRYIVKVGSEEVEPKAAKVTTVKVGGEATTMDAPKPAVTVEVKAKKTTRKANK